MKLSRMSKPLSGALVMSLLAVSAISASERPQVSLEDRIDGAESVVVAKTERVSAVWQQNGRGDRVIVSRVLLRVEESLKGKPAATVWMEVEGGSLDGMTLHVSDTPELKEGERAVFMLEAGSSGLARPHRRGQGILKLDDDDNVAGSQVPLSEIRRAASRRNGN